MAVSDGVLLATKRVISLIEKSGKAIDPLEKDIGVSQGTLKNLKNGKNLVSLDCLLKLSNYFNFSLDYITGRQEFYSTDAGINVVEESNGDHIVLFFDILGSSSEMMKSNPEYVEKLKVVHHIVRLAIIFGKERYGLDLMYSFFTDNFLIALKCEERNLSVCLKEFLAIMATLQQNVFIDDGLLLRGAICFGDLFFSKNVISGEAVVRGHNLESKVSIFPRIIVEESILKSANLVSEENYHSIVTEDVDGLFFLSWFITPGDEDRNEKIRKRIIEKANNKNLIDDLPAMQKNEWLWRSYQKARRQYDKDKFMEEYMSVENNFFNQNGDNNVVFGDNSTIHTEKKQDPRVDLILIKLFEDLPDKDKMDILEECFHRREKK